MRRCSEPTRVSSRYPPPLVGRRDSRPDLQRIGVSRRPLGELGAIPWIHECPRPPSPSDGLIAVTRVDSSTCRRPSPARRRPAPTSRGRSRSRRRPSQAAGHRRQPVRGRRRHDDRRRPCRRRRCGRSVRRAAGRARRSRPAWRDSAANDSGPTKRSRGRGQHHRRRRRPRRAAGGAARPPCRRRSSR